MSQDDARPRTGDMRFTAAGDVEVFDGDHWHPVASLMGEAGMRQDPAKPEEPRTDDAEDPAE